MNKLYFVLLMAVSSWAMADPTLVWDHDGTAEYFEVQLDAAVVGEPTTPAWDLAGIADGQHTAIVRACNMWGCSEDSVPFDFTAGAPGVPTNLRIESVP